MSTDLFLEGIDALANRRLDALGLLQVTDALSAQGQPQRAAQLYRLWLDSHPDAPERGPVLFNLSIALAASGDLGAAVASLDEALERDPAFHAARVNRGIFLSRTGDSEGAMASWHDVLERLGALTPEALHLKTLALRHLAHSLERAQREDEAEPVLRALLALESHDPEISQHWISTRQAQCCWPLLEPVETHTPATLRRRMPPLALAAHTDDPWLLLAAGAAYTPWRPEIAPLPCPARPTDDGTRRVRVGYVSADLRGHAVGSLVPEVFVGHDRTRFEIFAFYTGPAGLDGHRLRLQQSVEHWQELTGLDDDSAARQIAAADLDLLVDLNGHTDGARPGIIARRPAPILINWLGYPGTTGSPFHHYIIADDWIIPPSHEKYYSEKVLRLPCYQPNDLHREIGPVPSRAEAGLPEEAVVYCCFNAAYKITRFTFERWISVLAAVPDGVLWLLDPGRTTRERLQAEAQARGIDPARLVFAPRVPNPVHLARYALADLFLDTAPYGAHTTASDALWRGVPVLTWSGRAFASRVCGSLVRAAGLPDLVCKSPEDYTARAIMLGQDAEARQTLRARLAAAHETCVLFDMTALVRRLEALYEALPGAPLPVPDLTGLDTVLALGVTLDPDREEIGARPDYDDLYRALMADLPPAVQGPRGL
ncbi:tetratricopeptide repeat protein [Pararhodospirillum photometricum]|uniref:O-linked N-acetylglucosamine transferase, SPINDLY family protein n=1 Tax=Pararhodospirillum photometricum TaxID=1084 RepID=UPI0002DB8D4F|nr:tetratricopeptide repeat protein [Pararhodospirillum photometricum]